jgi:hypothetical protein
MDNSVTETTIINAALFLTGAKKITSDSDDTKSARLAKTMFPLARSKVFALRGIEWQFARGRATLTQMTTDPDFGYEYQYELPADCVRVIAIVDTDGDDTEYKFRREIFVDIIGESEREYDVILTDESSAPIRYIRHRTNVGCWPAYFAWLVSVTLAIMLCEPLKQDKQKKSQLMLLYEDAYDDAKAGNAMESADTDSDNTRLDLGNTQVVDAAVAEEVPKKYIKVE